MNKCLQEYQVLCGRMVEVRDFGPETFRQEAFFLSLEELAPMEGDEIPRIPSARRP